MVRIGTVQIKASTESEMVTIGYEQEDGTAELETNLTFEEARALGWVLIGVTEEWAGRRENV
jgi:hypothetical protein